jgi:putative redox protein
MASHQTETQWMGKMLFNALVNGHTISMDAPERAGGEDQGPIPKPFLLTALSGCTGMDVVALLRKWSQEIGNLNIRAEGELSKGSPVTYTRIHLVYEAEGQPDQREAVMEAIRLSQEQYCGVSYLLKKAIPVTWEIWFNKVLAFRNDSVGEMV